MNRRWIFTIPILILLASPTTAQQFDAGYQPPRPRNQGLLPVSQANVLPGLLPNSVPSVRRRPQRDLFPNISRSRMLASLDELTAIGRGALWRTSGSRGETQALAWMEDNLKQLSYLASGGLTLENQRFPINSATEVWETSLTITIGDKEFPVPVQALLGYPEYTPWALPFDSDGRANDSDRNPKIADGAAKVIDSLPALQALKGGELRNQVVFLDYALIDRSIVDFTAAEERALVLLQAQPTGVVLVTQYSNRIGDSHGSFATMSSIFIYVTSVMPATCLLRIEDLAETGIVSMNQLNRIEEAHLVWDEDVFSPATSGNLMARIPGVDSSNALILGAHIDSPNTPGALDDGSGSIALLEVARVLNEMHIRPAVDLYLVWFGSEEIGLAGSSYFVTTHQDILRRTLGLLQFDCLTHPLDGINAVTTLGSRSYELFGDYRTPFASYLLQKSSTSGIDAALLSSSTDASDHIPFLSFDVPSTHVIYENPTAMAATGSVHYAGHLHDPYETTELVRAEIDAFEDMVRVALVTVTETGRDKPPFRVTPTATHRAVFVASHTEPILMTPAGMTELSMTLAWNGFQVDVIPYGQPVTSADLFNADMVIVLPTICYQIAGSTKTKSEKISNDELVAIEKYIAEGGFVVLTNSAYRLRRNYAQEPNPNWAQVNPLASRFGISYMNIQIKPTLFLTRGNHSIVKGVPLIEVSAYNSIPFQISKGTVLSSTGSLCIAALVPADGSRGEILALADLGILGKNYATSDAPTNLVLWQNLANYAKQR